MRARWLLLAGLLTACAGQGEPASPEEAAGALRDAGPSYEALHRAAEVPRQNPLAVVETGLLGLDLGAAPERAKAVLGAPTRTSASAAGTWWLYDEDARLPSGGHLRLLFAGEPQALVQIQAWAPSRAETRTMVRPFDSAERLTRKYGAPFRKLPWGEGAEAWIYSASNVAYVLTEAAPDAPRRVAGIIVGL